MVTGNLKICVLAGGIGDERDISIKSGKTVAQALTEGGLDVILSDIKPDKLEVLEDDSIDIFFIALHGVFGEDGRLQQILEDKSLFYTGSGPAACELAFDKMASKKAFIESGIATPEAIEFNDRTDMEKFLKQPHRFGDRFVVKPIRQGSSVGISVIDGTQSVLAEARDCLNRFGDCMVEEFIPGRDITVGILCDMVLPIIELRTQEGFYDYHAKYLDETTEFLFDSIDDTFLVAAIKEAAMDCFGALGCRHFARVDFRLADDGTVYALELNAIPGFTARSDLPKAAEKTGISMGDLCMRIIEAAGISSVNQSILKNYRG